MSKKGTLPGKRIAAGGILVLSGSASLRFDGDWRIAFGMILLGVALAVLPFWYWYRFSRHGVAAMTNQARKRAERNEGFVSWRERMALSSRWAMRKVWARRMRPDLFTVEARLLVVRIVLMWWLLLRVDVREYAVDLGKDNYGGFLVPLNSVILRMASARSGKSVAMGGRLIDHRGPAVVTTVRKDLLMLTAQLRSKVGNLLVFNPGFVGNIASNFKWSVLQGCKDMTTAERRAQQLIGDATTTEEREYWNDHAFRVLAPMMYAAAWAGLSMRAVRRWVAAGGENADRAHMQIRNVLERTPEGPAQLENVDQFFGMIGAGDKTRLSITNTIAQVLKWLGNPRVAALGDAQGDDLFDLTEFFRSNDTIYVLGGENRGTAALTGCLLAEIFHQASLHAETQRFGRLAPPLLLMFDEVALTVRGQPVPRWVKSAGGSGICMDLGIQSRSSLDEVWGLEGRKVIMDNSHAVLIGAGCNDVEALMDYEKLSGTRLVPQVDAKGNILPDAPMQRVPIVSLQNLKELTIGNVVCYSRGPVTKLRTENAEDRRDVRKAGGYVPPRVEETDFEQRTRAEQLDGDRDDTAGLTPGDGWYPDRHADGTDTEGE